MRPGPRGDDGSGRGPAGHYREGMAKTWVLRTETKGTGAEVVPLESVTQQATSVEPVFIPRKSTRSADADVEPESRAPLRFRVVDVMTREPLLDDGAGPEAIEALRHVRSIVDVDVYVWHPERDRWRRLTFAEERAMFELA